MSEAHRLPPFRDEPGTLTSEEFFTYTE